VGRRDKFERRHVMKKVIRINYIFWKEGPLLPGLLACRFETA